MVLLSVAIAGAVAAAGVVTYGRDALWAEMFGPPDLGPYDFDLPTRTGKLNDALFCPDGDQACLGAIVDRITPLFAAEGPTLYAEVRRRILGLSGVEIVEENAGRGLLRAVVRTPVFRFPDTVSMRVREEAPGRSALWLYSRSQIGHADLGTNERRLRRILRDLRRSVPLVPADG